MTDSHTIDEINALTRGAFLQLLGGIYEHSPWVAEGAYGHRPFENLGALEDAMRAVVQDAPGEKQVAILSAHPEFSGKEAICGTLTARSRQEQSRLNLNALTGDDLERMVGLNRRFMEKFGFPGIVAVRLQDSVDSIFSELERRLDNDFGDEVREALEQVHQIARFRLHDLVADGC